MGGINFGNDWDDVDYGQEELGWGGLAKFVVLGNWQKSLKPETTTANKP